MKWLKRLGITVLLLPTILLVIWGLYEVYGMFVNHMTTEEQTRTLQANVETENSDIEIENVYSETGNT